MHKTVLAVNSYLLFLSCFRNKIISTENWVAYGGDVEFSANHEELQKRDVISIVPHPEFKYNGLLYTNDIVLVQLKEPFLLAGSTEAICLPLKEADPQQTCVVASWVESSPMSKKFLFISTFHVLFW